MKAAPKVRTKTYVLKTTFELSRSAAIWLLAHGIVFIWFSLIMVMAPEQSAYPSRSVDIKQNKAVIVIDKKLIRVAVLMKDLHVIDTHSIGLEALLVKQSTRHSEITLLY